MPRIIKKYANRRLYDTEASRHVTLDGLRRLVVEGEDIEVIDDTNGEDITRTILLQVISEQEQGGRPILSAEMLKQIIRFYGNPMQDFMGQYLEQSVNTFLSQQRAMQEQVKRAFSGTPFTAVQDIASKNLELWSSMQEAMMRSFQPGRSRTDEESSSGSNE